ncbi:MAG: hypothetical protein ACTSUW_07310 [Candidatus Heimdallarchaeota archaeon]
MNKKLAIILPIGIVGLIIASMFIVPMIIYGGATVPVVEGTVSFDCTQEELAGLSTNSLTPGISNVTVVLENNRISAINYGYDGINGRNQIADENPSTDISLQLSIMLVITKDGIVIKEIDIGAMNDEGLHEVTILFGPEEGLVEAGTYELTIRITLELQTPGTDLSLNIELGPFVFNFDPEQES